MNSKQLEQRKSVLIKLWVSIVVCLCLQTTFSQKQTVKTSGDVLLFSLPAIAIGTTLIKGDTKGSLQFTKSFLLNGAITFGLKSIVAKERPNMENNDSFPSGHTSIAFQGASFIQKRYGWKYGIPAYILAGYTGFSRLNTKKHDIYDVVAGAVIGIGSTYLFTTPYQQEHMELIVNTADGNYLLGFRYNF